MYRSEKYKRTIGFTEDMEAIFDILAIEFLNEWLNEDGSNQIQKIWKRQDGLSTTELFTLGYAIKVMLEVDRQWTKKQIRKCKNPDTNNSKGAIFEIIALAMLNSPKHPVRTVKEDNEGFDGILAFVEGKDIRVSIKNYGISDRQKDFEMFAEYVKDRIVKLLQHYKYPPVQIIIDSPTEYPVRSEWFKLINRLDDIFQNIYWSADRFTAIVSAERWTYWTIMVGDLPPEAPNSFHPNYNSYSIIISGRYHRNEYLNVFSKMDKAYQNLSKHSSVESEDLRNCLFIHLPMSVDIEQCHKWIEEYYKKNQGVPISYVFLYQPNTVRNDAGDSSIVHVTKVAGNPNVNYNWLPNFDLTLITGTPGINIRPHLHASFEDGTIDNIPLGNRYVYQKGKHYVKMRPQNDGSLIGNITSIANGIEVIPVIEIPGEIGGVTISGKFPPSDDFMIL